MRLMKFVQNANANDATVAISVGDDRPTIQMGGVGEMTDREIANATSMGHVLLEVDDGGLAKMKVSDLEAKAEKLGVELDEDDSRDEKVSKLRARLAAGPEDPAETAIGGSGATRGAVAGTTPATTSATANTPTTT